MTRRADGEERDVDVPIVLVVTDRRVLFVSADAGDGDARADAGALSYAELAGTAVEDGRVELSTTAGVAWCVTLSDGGDGLPDSVVRHLRWVGEVRARLVSCGIDLHHAAAEMESLAAAGDWGAARAVYDRARETLDRLIDAVQRVEPIADSVLAPRLTEFERTLEAAYAGVFLERAETRLTLGQRLVERGVYERAGVLVERAREDYRQARVHAASVERADAFQFGEQRTAHERLERLRWEIDAVAAAPLRRAYEAKAGALSAADATVKVERLERAFRRFGRLLTLLASEADPVFAGDSETLSDEVVAVAGQLVVVHRTLARIEWDEEAAGDDGSASPAVRRLDAGIEHAERALALAEQFRPDAAAGTADLLDRMREVRDRYRETGDAAFVLPTDDLQAGSRMAGPDPTDGEPQPAGGESARTGGRRRELLASGDREGLAGKDAE